MNMKRFHETDMHAALKKIREELGENAVIISSKQDVYGVEVIAANDYEKAVSKNSDNNEKINKNTSLDKVDDVKRVQKSTVNNNKFVEDEIKKLRHAIESQTEMISWSKIINDSSIVRKYLQKLSISGFGFDLSKVLISKIKDTTDPVLGWKKIEQILAESIPTVKKNIIDSGGVVALVGPTGVGKTTTIAKIAAKFALKNGSKNLALISTDHYRIGAHDQISTYASILNIPVISAANQNELKKALISTKDKKLILIDTPGLSQRDSRVEKIMKLLSEQSKEIIKYLVLSSNSQLCVQKEIINQFNPKYLDGVIISKTDEASQIGGVLTTLIGQKLPVAFETNGQRVPEDISFPNQKELVRRSFSLGKNYRHIETIHPTELYSELI